MTDRLVLHEYSASGNCYKVRLTAALVGIHLDRREYDIMKGETRTTDFLQHVNANGRIPVLQVGDRFIPESNAACYYIGNGSNLIPTERFDHSDMLRWMFWEQYSHEPYIAVARFWRHFFTKLTPQQEIELPGRMEKGYAALGVMEQHLAHHLFFVDERFGLADIALYAYTHCAGEGGFNLDNFPQVNAWLARVAAQPGHVTIEHKN